MTEIVNAFSKFVTVVLFACSHFRHGEIRGIQRNTLGIYTDENFRNGFNVKVGIKVNQANGVGPDALKTVYALENIVFVSTWVSFAVFSYKYKSFCFGSKHGSDVGNPSPVFSYCPERSKPSRKESWRHILRV